MEGKSVLERKLGSSPVIKVISFFLTFREFDYSKSQIAEETGVSRITVNKVLQKLVKENILSKTRKIGRSQLYKLASENEQVKKLIELDNALCEIEAGKEKPRQSAMKAIVR